MSNPTTVHYAWKEKIRDEFGERYIVPMGDPHEYEFPYDALFGTPQEARERLMEDIEQGFFDNDGPGAGVDPNQLVLVKITEEPVE